MLFSDLLQLVLLAAIWGMAFLFLKVVSPVLGPMSTSSLRLLIGGGVLIIYFRRSGQPLNLARYWRQYFWIGILSSAIPFTLFSFSALHLPASHIAVVNASAPLFGVCFAFLWLKEKMDLQKLLGLALGGLGVALAVHVSPTEFNANYFWAVIAGLVASAAYAGSGIYMKAVPDPAPSNSIAIASQIAAGLSIIPLIPLGPSVGQVDWQVIASLLTLGVLCSAVAYIMYFRLVERVGPTRSLTVTFLMPIFGVLWGALFLGEAISWALGLGCLLVLVGTGFVLKK